MRASHLGLALSLVFIWGFTFVMIEAALRDLSPLFLCFIRFFLTSIPAVFFIKFPSTSFKLVALYGIFLFALTMALLFMGMHSGVSSGLASTLMQSQVFFTILLAVVFLGEKLRRWQAIGAIVAFSGIALIGMKGGGSVTFSGFLLVIAAALCWAIGNVISKKIGKVNTISLVIWGSLIAWPPLLVMSVILEGSDRILFSLQNLSWITVGAVVYITYLATLVGFWIWSWLLNLYPLPMIAPFTLLVPIIAMTSSVFITGETLPSWKIGAGLLVIAGLCIDLLSSRLGCNKRS